jgi:hypothetical protein
MKQMNEIPVNEFWCVRGMFHEPSRNSLERYRRYDEETGQKRPARLPHPIDTGVHRLDDRFLPGRYTTLSEALGGPWK